MFVFRPVFCLVSANIQTGTLEHFLLEAKSQVEKRAHEIVEGEIVLFSSFWGHQT